MEQKENKETKMNKKKFDTISTQEKKSSNLESWKKNTKTVMKISIKVKKRLLFI